MRGPRLVLFFPLKIGEDQKKVFFFMIRPPIFPEALGFSLPSLLVNSALVPGSGDSKFFACPSSWPLQFKQAHVAYDSV